MHILRNQGAKSMKKIAMLGAVLAVGAMLAGCGPRVEVETASVGKVMTKNGLQDDIKMPSKFRLDSCWWPGAYCDKLVVLDVSDISKTQDIKLFMPKDRLNMDFTVGLTLSVDDDAYDELFAKINPSPSGEYTSRININEAYDRYAKEIISSQAREFMSQYSISEVANNRDVIGSELSEHLSVIIRERTPFYVRYAGLTDVQYPEIITTAQENAAERRENIQQERAQLEVSRVKLERELEEQRLQRKVDVEKAEAQAEINRILGESITERYVQYRQLDALDKLAVSNNTKVIPFEMMSSVASQVALGNDMK